MRLRVCRDFRDKHTGEVYRAGAEIEVTKKRATEILENPLGLAEAVEEPKPQKTASRGRKRGGGK